MTGFRTIINAIWTAFWVQLLIRQTAFLIFRIQNALPFSPSLARTTHPSLFISVSSMSLSRTHSLPPNPIPIHTAKRVSRHRYIYKFAHTHVYVHNYPNINIKWKLIIFSDTTRRCWVSSFARVEECGWMCITVGISISKQTLDNPKTFTQLFHSRFRISCRFSAFVWVSEWVRECVCGKAVAAGVFVFAIVFIRTISLSVSSTMSECFQTVRSVFTIDSNMKYNFVSKRFWFDNSGGSDGSDGVQFEPETRDYNCINRV